MANTNYVIPADALDIRIVGRKMTDFPSTGTFMTIEKIDPIMAYQAGRNRTMTWILNDSTVHRVNLTLMAFHKDDAFMSAAVKGLLLGQLLTFSFTMNSTVYASDAIGIETVPNVELAADSSPARTWPLIGNFPLAVIGAWAQPGTLTEAQINSFIP